MSKFENFLKQVLTAIFSETPFDKQKAEEGLEKIKSLQEAASNDDRRGYDKKCD